MHPAEQQALFDDWLNQHKGLIFKVVRAYAFTENDQDDLFQEICERMWKSIPEFRGESQVSTWLYRVSLYTAITWSKKTRRHEKTTQPLAEVAHSLSVQDSGMDERVAWLYAQIATLNEIDRSLCLLLLDGYSYEEMAEIVGITSNHVGVKIHRIKRQLLQAANQGSVSAE